MIDEGVSGDSSLNDLAASPVKGESGIGMMSPPDGIAVSLASRSLAGD